LLLSAKHLFVAAILAGPPASPFSQGTGRHRAPMGLVRREAKVTSL
jgi:hypothetical protein